MEHVLETAVFDEIYFAECEAKLGVLDALFYECDKLENIMRYSENSNEFQIVQESFTKPAKNESTLTKVALAIPRFIYMIIKKIVEGFKNAFGKKNSFATPQNVENASEIIKNLTGNEEFMKMACGAAIGAFAAVKLFCKNRYTEAKTKWDNFKDEKLRREDIKSSSQKNYNKFRALAMDAIDEHLMYGFYVNENGKLGIILFTNLDDLRDKAIKTYLKSIADHVSDKCGDSNHYKSKTSFNKLLDDVLFDIDHNTVLYSFMIPDTVDPKDYTLEEYQSAIQKFTSASFEQTIESYMKKINGSIVQAYQTFESNTEKAEKKEDKLSKEAQTKYCDRIASIIGRRIEFMQEWVVKLNESINEAITEYNAIITDKSEKLTPNVEMSNFAKAEWMKDKTLKDIERQKEKAKKEAEEASKENKEEAKEEKSDEKESSKKEDDNKKEEKESDD